MMMKFAFIASSMPYVAQALRGQLRLHVDRASRVETQISTKIHQQRGRTCFIHSALCTIMGMLLGPKFEKDNEIVTLESRMFCQTRMTEERVPELINTGFVALGLEAMGFTCTLKNET